MLILTIAIIGIILSLGALLYCMGWFVKQAYDIINDSIMEYQYRKAKKEVTTYFETLEDVIRDYRSMYWA